MNFVKDGTLKSYENSDFIKSREGRPIRILSEFLEPQSRLSKLHISDTITFFGSARILSKEEALLVLNKATKSAVESDIQEAEMRLKMSDYYEKARSLSNKLTLWSKTLETPLRRFVVATGGGPGIMEAANRGASEAKGLNIGFNITLPKEQHYNQYITSTLNFNFHYFFIRKFWLAYLAKAFIVFPGGFGTLDELMEILTLVQTKKMEKKVPIILFGTEFWYKIIDFEYLIKTGMISKEDMDIFIITDSVDEAYDYLIGKLTEWSMTRPGDTL